MAPTAFPPPDPLLLSNPEPGSFAFKPALTKGSKKPVTPKKARVHVTSSVQTGFQGSELWFQG